MLGVKVCGIREAEEFLDCGFNQNRAMIDCRERKPGSGEPPLKAETNSTTSVDYVAAWFVAVLL